MRTSKVLNAAAGAVVSAIFLFSSPTLSFAEEPEFIFTVDGAADITPVNVPHGEFKYPGGSVYEHRNWIAYRDEATTNTGYDKFKAVLSGRKLTIERELYLVNHHKPWVRNWFTYRSLPDLHVFIPVGPNGPFAASVQTKVTTLSNTDPAYGPIYHTAHNFYHQYGRPAALSELGQTFSTPKSSTVSDENQKLIFDGHEYWSGLTIGCGFSLSGWGWAKAPFFSAGSEKLHMKVVTTISLVPLWCDLTPSKPVVTFPNGLPHLVENNDGDVVFSPARVDIAPITITNKGPYKSHPQTVGTVYAKTGLYRWTAIDMGILFKIPSIPPGGTWTSRPFSRHVPEILFTEYLATEEPGTPPGFYIAVHVDTSNSNHESDEKNNEKLRRIEFPLEAP